MARETQQNQQQQPQHGGAGTQGQGMSASPAAAGTASGTTSGASSAGKAGTSGTSGAGANAPEGTNRPATARSGQPSDQERSIATGGNERGRASTSREVARPRATGMGNVAAGSPLRLMQRMAQDMDRLFEQFGFGRSGFSLSPSLAPLLDDQMWSAPNLVGTEQTIWSPQVEVFQRGDKMVVRADLPGVKKEDLQVDVQNDVLTLSGERREEHEDTSDGWYRSERSYGRFFRAIPLPEGANAEDVDATFNNGVLEVSLSAPRQQESKAKHIQIR